MLASLALAAAFASPGCSLPAATGRPFGPGERLVYDLEAYGVTRARGATFVVQPAAPGAPLTLAAETTFSAPFYAVRGSARSSVDPGTLRPRTFHDESDDGSRSTTDSQLDRDSLAIRVYWAKGGVKGMNAYLKQGAVLDVVSALYYLRAAPLEAGASFCFDAVGGRAYWRLRGRVAGAERVDTPAGRFDTVRLEGTAVRADQPGRSYPIRLWISSDARRLPVRLTAATAVGTVGARLASASPLDHTGKRDDAP